MIEHQLQFELFRAAKQAGDDAGFELYSVIVFSNEAQYTWERKRTGSETLKHQVNVLRDDLESAARPDILIGDIFLKQAKAMQYFREMHEQA